MIPCQPGIFCSTSSHYGFSAFKFLVKLAEEGFSNSLVSEVIALRINIQASELGITPSGFGDLIFEDVANPFCNGKPLTEIANFADTVLTYWRGRDSSVYRYLNQAIAAVNTAFDFPIDSTNRSNFFFTGKTKLYEVQFLKREQAGKLFSDFTSTHQTQLPKNFLDVQNYPNPFNPSTSIQFLLNEDGVVSLTVYDLLGRKVAQLLNNAELSSGQHEIFFDASQFSSGFYLYSLSLNRQQTITKKMLLVK